MLKRFFLFALILCCTVAPSVQAGEKVRIASVLSSSIEPYNDSLKGFYEALDEKGIVYERHEFVLGENGDVELISKLKELSPEIIHTVGTKATLVVKEKIYDLPLVFSMVLNPVASGIVENMEAPGGNISGASMDIPLSSQFEYMKKVLPRTATVGVIYSNNETGLLIADARKVAARMGVKLLAIEVNGPSEVASAMKQFAGKVDFLWSVADSNVFTRETTRDILVETLRSRLPFMGLSPGFVRAGALVALDADAAGIGRKAAEVAASVLEGRSPGKIPVYVPGEVRLVINKNTVDLLGIDISREIYGLAEVVNP